MPVHRHLSDLEHVGAGRDLERDPRVLLDDEHGQPVVLVELAHDREQLADDGRRQPERRLVEHEQPRAATSARPSASICCSPPLSVADAWSRRRSIQGKYPTTRSAASAKLAAPADGSHPQVLPDRQLGEETSTLRDVGDAEPRDRLRGRGG